MERSELNSLAAASNAMLQRAKSIGMEMVKVAPDGNCWVQCLADEENRIRKNANATCATVRAKTLAYICDHKQEFLQFYLSLPSSSKDKSTKEERFDQDCEKLKMDKKWHLKNSMLPDFLVEVYARVQKLNVRIYLQHSQYDLINDDSTNDRAHIALLRYKELSHYNILRPTANNEPKSSSPAPAPATAASSANPTNSPDTGVECTDSVTHSPQRTSPQRKIPQPTSNISRRRSENTKVSVVMRLSAERFFALTIYVTVEAARC
jgi:hypothetical protein